MNINHKKILAGVLSVTLLLSSVEFSSIVNNKFIAATINDKSLEKFMGEVSSLYEEDDLSSMAPDITFSKESENTVVIDDTIMVPVEVLTDNTDISYSDIKEDIVEQDNEELVAVEDVAKNTDYEAIKNNDESITLSKIYQSKTLIVKSPVQIDTYDAENVISGYGNLYILKYATEEDTKDAYDKFLKNKNIDSVEIDSLISAETLESLIEETTEESVEENTETSTEEITEESSEGITETSETTESSEDTSTSEEITETLPETENSEELSSESTEETTTEQETETMYIPDGVIVAILDSGIDVNNTLFDGRIVDLGLNLSTSGEGIQDDNGHGTAVASVIAKNSDAYLMPIKIANSDGKGTVLSLYLAIQAAIENEADVINLSLTASSSDLLTSIIEEAEQKGIIVVAAAGNQNANVENYAPANIESVITVAATDEKYRPASYSNYGNLVDYSALGTLLNEEDSLKGTSISAAYVTGVIAKILCENENANVTEELSKYVYDFGEEGKDDYYGNGVVSLEEITAPEETEDDEILIPEDTPEEGINLEAATTINGVVYTYASNTLTLTGSGTVTNEWQSYNTTWAGYVTGVKSININSDTLTGIDANAFEGCTNLTTVTFTKYNNGVVNTNAFADIPSLSTLTIGNAITSINANAFEGCTSLNTLTIGTGVTFIGEDAFKDAPLATKITFNAVDLITHNDVFQNKETASLAIGTGVTQLPDGIFRGLSKITAVTIPAKCTSIAYSAFEDCLALAKVTFASGSTCTEIGNAAFRNCTALSNVVNNTTNYTLPATVTAIGDNAFENCTSMTTFITGNGVATIGKLALGGCTSLNTLTIGTGVTSIEEDAFKDAPLATKITFNAVDLITHNDVFQNKETASLVIGTGVTQLPNGIFKGLSKITAVTIPAKCTSIGSSAFENCSALKTVTFASGSTCTEIGDSAFKNCTSLSSIVDNTTANRLPNVIKTLGDSAFENTAFISLQSGTSAITGVTTIGNDVFKGCDTLIHLTLYNQACVIANKDAIPDTTMIYGLTDSTVEDYATRNNKLFTTIGTTNVSGTDGNITWKLTLSSGALAISGTGDMNDYKVGVAPWYKYRKLIKTVTIASTVTAIGDSAFEDCLALTKVTFASGSKCTQIGNNAFKNCTALSNVVNNTTNYTLPATVISVGDNAFENCTSMTTFITGNGVATIGKLAFSGCTSLNTLTIGTGVTSIEADAFKDAPLATKITLNATNLENHNNVFNGKETVSITIANATQLLDGLFKDCTKLTTITIPATVTAIGDSAFEDCLALTKVTFASGSKCTQIGNAAFKNCTSLSSIVDNTTANRLPNVIKTLGDSAFENTALISLQSGTSATTGVTSIGNDVFKGCNTLIHLTLYNQACVIVNKDAIPDTTMIYGLAGSTVESYATENGKLFVAIGTTYVSGTDGNITWKLTLSSGALAISGTGDMNDYKAGVAPWYQYRELIKTVTIAKTVTSIGSFAFEDCSALTKLTFASGSTCEKIGNAAFKNCTSLSNVVNNTTNYTLPATVTFIGDNAFENCTSMTTIVTGNGVDIIGNSAFSGCEALNTLTIGTGVTFIGKDAFKDAPLATKITFNASNLITHNDVFQNKETASLAIGTGVTQLPNGIFKGLSKITAITIPAKCTSIGDSAFEECTALATLTFTATSTCEKIGNYAFYNCTSLISIKDGSKSLEFPTSIMTYGNYCFYNAGFLYKLNTVNNVIRFAPFPNRSTTDADGDGVYDCTVSNTYYDNLKVGYNSFGVDISTSASPQTKIIKGYSGNYTICNKNIIFTPKSYNYVNFDSGWLNDVNAPGVIKGCAYGVTYKGEIDSSGNYVDYDKTNIDNDFPRTDPFSCIFISTPIYLQENWSISYTANVQRCHGAEGALAVYLIDEEGNVLQSDYRRSICEYSLTSATSSKGLVNKRVEFTSDTTGYYQIVVYAAAWTVYHCSGGNGGSGLTSLQLNNVIVPDSDTKLTINPNGGEYEGSTEIREIGISENSTLNISVPTRTGYTFTGWTLEGAGSTMTSLTEPATFRMGTVDATLTANWKRNTFTVSYDGNGATSGSMASQTFNYGGSVNISSNGFVKTGYTFTSWNTKADGSGVLYQPGQTYSTNNNLTLYAQWKIGKIDIPVTITWVDKNNEYASRPSKVTLRLMNGTEVVKEAKIVTGDNTAPASTNVWTYKFEDVDMYDSNGKEIQYTVVEGAYTKAGTFVANAVSSSNGAVEYKTPVYGGDNSGLTVVNALSGGIEPDEDPTKDYGVTISGTVTWQDENDKYHFRPDSVIVELYQDGKLYDSVELNEGTTDYKFTGLPMMDSSFKKYTYTIKEKDIDNYKITYESDDNTTTVEDDFGNTVTTTTYTVDITNTFTPDKETERFSDNQLTMQATFLNESGNAATESDFKKVKLDKEDVNTTIVLKQLNLSWEPVNAEEGKYLETYSGYSGNEINLILHGTERTYVNYIPYGKYEIMVEKNTNFSLESIEELDSNNVQFTYENGKYYLTYSYEFEEAKEDLNVNMTLKSWRGYTSKMGVRNFFKNSN